MYTNLIMATNANVTARNDALRWYARWEYGTGDVTWFLRDRPRATEDPHREALAAQGLTDLSS